MCRTNLFIRVMRGWRTRRALLAASAALVALVTAACGSSSSSSTSSSATTATSASTGTSNACVQKAQAAVAQAAKPMQLTPGPALKGKSLAGKTIWFISPDQSIPYVAQQAAAVAQAASSLGITLKIFDGKSNPALFNQGFSTAVSQHAAGIMLNSTDPALVSGPLKQAMAAHIPVVDVLIGLPGQPQFPGVYITLRTNTPQIGATMTDVALANTSCKTSALILTTSLYPFDKYLSSGAQAEFKTKCPSCKVTVKSIDPTTVATTIGPLTTNALQTDPSINYMLPAYTGLIPYMLPAMAQLNKKIPIVSAAGVNADFDQVRAGTTSGNVALPPAGYFGYLQFDAILRAMLHLAPPNGTVPTQLIDKSNVGSNNSLSTLFPGIANYQSTYEKLWGAS